MNFYRYAVLTEKRLLLCTPGTYRIVSLPLLHGPGLLNNSSRPISTSARALDVHETARHVYQRDFVQNMRRRDTYKQLEEDHWRFNVCFYIMMGCGMVYIVYRAIMLGEPIQTDFNKTPLPAQLPHDYDYFRNADHHVPYEYAQHTNIRICEPVPSTQ